MTKINFGFSREIDYTNHIGFGWLNAFGWTNAHRSTSKTIGDSVEKITELYLDDIQ